MTAGPSGLCPSCGYGPPMPAMPASRGSDLGEWTPLWRRPALALVLVAAVLAVIAAVR